MPAPVFSNTPAATRPRCSIAIEPAMMGFNSLTLLWKTGHLTGLDDWVTRTAAALFPEERQNNNLILNGLHYAAVPRQSYPSFPAYVDALEAVDPFSLRDRLLNAYDMHDCELIDTSPAKSLDEIGISALMEDVDIFLDFLVSRFSAEHIDFEVERQAHRYLIDPPAMQKLMVTHLRHMWQKYMAVEFEKTLPLLQESLHAFEQVNFNEMSNFEAAQLVTNQDIEHLRPESEKREHLVLVPSPHLGPYTHYITNEDTLWLLFGARVPEGYKGDVPNLNRSEILVRLNGLADDTRLRILKLLASEGELASTDIMDRLDLSQSAASRHLKQLSANGYLCESRLHNAKHYRLNPPQIENTLQAVSAFLLPD